MLRQNIVNEITLRISILNLKITVIITNVNYFLKKSKPNHNSLLTIKISPYFLNLIDISRIRLRYHLILMILLMFQTSSFLLVSHNAIITLESLLVVGMFISLMLFKGECSWKCHITYLAFVLSQFLMNTNIMILKLWRGPETLNTLLAFVRFQI